MQRNLRLKMTAKMQISLAVIRVNDVKMYPSISLAIRVFTANENACGGCLAFYVCSGAYLIIIFFGNQANDSGLISVGFRVQHFADTPRCRYGKPVNRRMRTLLHDTFSTSLSFATCFASIKLVINFVSFYSIIKLF